MVQVKLCAIVLYAKLRYNLILYFTSASVFQLTSTNWTSMLLTLSLAGNKVMMTREVTVPAGNVTRSSELGAVSTADLGLPSASM